MNYEGHGGPSRKFAANVGDIYTNVDTGDKYELDSIVSTKLIKNNSIEEEIEYFWELIHEENGGSGGASDADQLIERTITEISSNAASVGARAFYYCPKLTTVDLPKATSIGEYAFYFCDPLKTVNIPSATSIGSNAFNNCSLMTTINMPKVATVGTYAFNYCSALKSVDLPSATVVDTRAFVYCSELTTVDLASPVTINSYAFENCSKLKTLLLRSETVATLGATNAFSNTAISKGTGYIYVPRALVDTYKSAANWSTYANQFRAIEDYVA